MNWFEKYQSIPFDKNGWTFEGAHCWGLINIVYKTELKIELPTYGEISAFKLAKVSRQFEKDKDGEDWFAVDRKKLKIFDVVVMRLISSSRIGHCGIYIGNGKLMHTEITSGVAIVPFSHHSVRERLAAFRRHRMTQHEHEN